MSIVKADLSAAMLITSLCLPRIITTVPLSPFNAPCAMRTSSPFLKNTGLGPMATLASMAILRFSISQSGIDTGLPENLTNLTTPGVSRTSMASLRVILTKTYDRMRGTSTFFLRSLHCFSVLYKGRKHMMPFSCNAAATFFSALERVYTANQWGWGGGAKQEECLMYCCGLSVVGCQLWKWFRFSSGFQHRKQNYKFLNQFYLIPLKSHPTLY
jgi:hypothetical protein